MAQSQNVKERPVKNNTSADANPIYLNQDNPTDCAAEQEQRERDGRARLQRVPDLAAIELASQRRRLTGATFSAPRLTDGLRTIYKTDYQAQLPAPKE